MLHYILGVNSPPAKPLRVCATRGPFLFNVLGDLVPVPPHLPKDSQRIEYLRNKGYFGETPFGDELLAQLSHINFHYFLGYARNYARLYELGIFKGKRDPQHVFDLISLDQKVATLLFDWIRRAELGLRNRTVDFFCANGSPTSYLDESRLMQLSEDYDEREIVGGMLKEIFRYGEDYVIGSLNKKADELGCKKPNRYSPASHDLCLSLSQDLALWSVIDCFSLGQLGKFIMVCDADVDDYEQRTWRRLAADLGMKAPVFSKGIESLSNTRNLVCHHARLWMRPATHSPKKPRIFDKQLRDVDPKSQLMAFANVAHFQRSDLKREALESIFSLAQSNEMYFYGISQTSHKKR